MIWRSIIASIQALNFSHLGMAIMLGLSSLKFSYSSPGRFFAINEIKLMLAFVLLRYDFLALDGVRPADWEFQGICIPNKNAETAFKLRDIDNKI